LGALFYGLTAFGHDAVMVFFVLSGYFISASILRDQQAERWSCVRYLLSRLTRLYLVLLPGLLLTLCWDRLGLAFYAQHPIYSGAQQPYHHDFFDVGQRLGIGTLLGNVFFTQDILAPPFGSNDALWSLSYEFWYYLLFPCLWFALAGIRGRRGKQSVPLLLLFLLLLVAVGKTMALYFPIWLMGTALCLAPQVSCLKRRYPVAVTALALGLFGGIVLARHTGPFRSLVQNSVLANDYITGASFALLLYFLLHDQAPTRSGNYTRIATSFAGFSYTLYVTRLPVLIFPRAALVPGAPWSPDAVHLSFAALLAFACIAYAFALSQLTEARTDQVRDGLLKRLAGSVRKGRTAPSGSATGMVAVDGSIQRVIGPQATAVTLENQ
jgi:peptidoglycan/LPS O-acetylase OafA/YrhL